MRTASLDSILGSYDEELAPSTAFHHDSQEWESYYHDRERLRDEALADDYDFAADPWHYEPSAECVGQDRDEARDFLPGRADEIELILEHGPEHDGSELEHSEAA